MSLRARLLLFGAVIPALLFCAAVLLSGGLFRRFLLEALDSSMRTQAAVEAVSLFDGPDGKPHLHLESSPISDRDASEVALYGADGGLVVASPDRSADAPARLDPATAPLQPQLATVRRQAGERRELLVRLQRDDGSQWALWLGHGLAHHQRASRSFAQASAIAVLLVSALLAAFQLRVSRQLAARVEALAAHMHRVQEGHLDDAPPPDAHADVLADLRGTIAAATGTLRASRAAQDRLVADAAHELRTPLASMRTAIDVTLRRERTPAELRGALEHAREEVDRLAALSAELLDLAAWRARPSPSAQEATNLQALALQAVEARRSDAGARGLGLALAPGPALLVRGGARELRQAVDNLLDNALKFSPPGGTVQVSLERAGEAVRLLVRDQGPGVPPGQQQAIFAPFHRADPSKPGTGLGLAIVAEIARSLGGSASVLPAPPPGATLCLELPAARPPA